MASLEAEMLEFIRRGLDHHAQSCPLAPKAILLNPGNHELFGWDELWGIPVLADDRVAPKRFRIDCDGSAFGIEEELARRSSVRRSRSSSRSLPGLGARTSRPPDLGARPSRSPSTTGPNPDATRRILELLGRHGARATFFIWGERAAQHPDVVREVVAAGHSVQPHCCAHVSHWTLEPSAIRADIDRVTSCSRELGGGRSDALAPALRQLLRRRERRIAAERGLRAGRLDRQLDD